MNLHSQISELPNTQEWCTHWFSQKETLDVLEALLREDVSYHDPQEHGQFFKRSHVLPQGSCVPSDCLPNPEEQQRLKQN